VVSTSLDEKNFAKERRTEMDEIINRDFSGL
jgi:hypothetical protein